MEQSLASVVWFLLLKELLQNVILATQTLGKLGPTKTKTRYTIIILSALSLLTVFTLQGGS